MGIPPNRWLRAFERVAAGVPADSALGRYFCDAYGLRAGWERVSRRYARMVETHAARFRSDAVKIARAPGRVNLIGEHTDYNGLPVFPMAVDLDIAAVFSPRPDRRIILVNTDPLFSERSFEIESSIPPYPTGDWGNYCKAAVQGLLDFYRKKKRSERFVGFEAAFDGELPVAAGLSSSSALVVLCALLFLAVNSLELYGSQERRLELADLLAGAETYVGTQGGGMDQAISLLGRTNHALKIDFLPLRVHPAPLPGGYSVVVADSMVKAAKTAGALDKYNRRPIECRLAAALLQRAFSKRRGREVPISLLGDLEEHKLAIAQSEIFEIADAALHEHPYTLQEIAGILGQSPEKTAHLYCRRRDGSIFPEPAEGFKLRPRYRHVIEEGRRVERSVELLEAGDISGFAELMNASHASCRDLYEISCPELNRLVEISREAGAMGSRLTGAGFGGCTVSLVENDQVGGFTRRVIQSYYRDYLGRDDTSFDSMVFSCRTAGGAGILAEP